MVVVVVVMRIGLESPCNVGSFEVLHCKNVPDDGRPAGRAHTSELREQAV